MTLKLFSLEKGGNKNLAFDFCWGRKPVNGGVLRKIQDGSPYGWFCRCMHWNSLWIICCDAVFNVRLHASLIVVDMATEVPGSSLQ